MIHPITLLSYYLLHTNFITRYELYNYCPIIFIVNCFIEYFDPIVISDSLLSLDIVKNTDTHIKEKTL